MRGGSRYGAAFPDRPVSPPQPWPITKSEKDEQNKDGGNAHQTWYLFSLPEPSGSIPHPTHCPEDLLAKNEHLPHPQQCVVASSRVCAAVSAFSTTLNCTHTCIGESRHGCECPLHNNGCKASYAIRQDLRLTKCPANPTSHGTRQSPPTLLCHHSHPPCPLPMP